MKTPFFSPAGTIKWLATAFITLSFAGLTACSSDDDDNNDDQNDPASELSQTAEGLETPAYEAVAALYDITDETSDLKSIELTASGDYIITKNYDYSYSYNYASARKSRSKLLPSTLTTRDAYGNIIWGKYTKISDTEYQLQGWGKIVIAGSSDNALSISVTPANGNTYTVPVQKHNQKPSSTATNQLCRTWLISSFRYTCSYQGGKFFDKEYALADIKNLPADLKAAAANIHFDFDDEDDEYDDEDYEDDEDDDFEDDLNEMPNRVIFSKAGSYMVQYRNSTMALATWSWENEATGAIRYSWNYYNMYDDELSGSATIAYRGSQLALSEQLSDAEDLADGLSIVATWYMTEDK